MFSGKPTRLTAALLAMLVTILWSTSFVLVKIGIKDIPSVTFAGLRYFIAFLCLLPFAFTPDIKREIINLKRKEWIRLFGIGILYYSITQGAIFVGLSFLPAMTVNLMLNMSPVLVTVMGIILLAEQPSLLQGLGVLINLAGVILYFFPVSIFGGAWIGFAAIIVGVFGNSISVIINRKINKSQRHSVMVLTLITMGFGSIVMLTSGIIVQGLPPIQLVGWGIIIWMAVMNTAIAFTLWNYTLRTLTAMESSILNGAMLVEIAIMAWIFLGERMSVQQIFGLVLAGCGAILVQLKFKNRRNNVVEQPLEIA
jgi:drug/metabolite transporter (DMT)-like permease